MSDVLGLRGKGRLDDGRCKMAEGRWKKTMDNVLCMMDDVKSRIWKRAGAPQLVGTLWFLPAIYYHEYAASRQ